MNSFMKTTLVCNLFYFASIILLPIYFACVFMFFWYEHPYINNTLNSQQGISLLDLNYFKLLCIIPNLTLVFFLGIICKVYLPKKNIFKILLLLLPVFIINILLSDYSKKMLIFTVINLLLIIPFFITAFCFPWEKINIIFYKKYRVYDDSSSGLGIIRFLGIIVGICVPLVAFYNTGIELNIIYIITLVFLSFYYILLVILSHIFIILNRKILFTVLSIMFLLYIPYFLCNYLNLLLILAPISYFIRLYGLGRGGSQGFPSKGSG